MDVNNMDGQTKPVKKIFTVPNLQKMDLNNSSKPNSSKAVDNEKVYLEIKHGNDTPIFDILEENETITAADSHSKKVEEQSSKICAATKTDSKEKKKIQKPRSTVVKNIRSLTDAEYEDIFMAVISPVLQEVHSDSCEINKTDSKEKKKIQKPRSTVVKNIRSLTDAEYEDIFMAVISPVLQEVHSDSCEINMKDSCKDDKITSENSLDDSKLIGSEINDDKIVAKRKDQKDTVPEKANENIATVEDFANPNCIQNETSKDTDNSKKAVFRHDSLAEYKGTQDSKYTGNVKKARKRKVKANQNIKQVCCEKSTNKQHTVQAAESKTGYNNIESNISIGGCCEEDNAVGSKGIQATETASCYGGEKDELEEASIVSEDSTCSNNQMNFVTEDDLWKRLEDQEQTNEHTPCSSDWEDLPRIKPRNISHKPTKLKKQRKNELGTHKHSVDISVFDCCNFKPRFSIARYMHMVMAANQKGKKRAKQAIEISDQAEIPEELGTWVQCCDDTCRKWRYLPDIHDPVQVDDFWLCSMHPDARYNSCDKEEQEYDESDHIFTQYTLGSVVWAKMDGFPWWPAIVDTDPDYDIYCEIPDENSMIPTDYHVVFLDEKITRTWLKKTKVRHLLFSDLSPDSIMQKMFGQKNHTPLSQLPERYLESYMKGHRYKKELSAAMRRAEKALSLPLKERLENFGFAACCKNINKKWARGQPVSKIKRGHSVQSTNYSSVPCCNCKQIAKRVTHKKTAVLTSTQTQQKTSNQFEISKCVTENLKGFKKEKIYKAGELVKNLKVKKNVHKNLTEKKMKFETPLSICHQDGSGLQSEGQGGEKLLLERKLNNQADKTVLKKISTQQGGKESALKNSCKRQKREGKSTEKHSLQEECSTKSKTSDSHLSSDQDADHTFHHSENENMGSRPTPKLKSFNYDGSHVKIEKIYITNPFKESTNQSGNNKVKKKLHRLEKALKRDAEQTFSKEKEEKEKCTVLDKDTTVDIKDESCLPKSKPYKKRKISETATTGTNQTSMVELESTTSSKEELKQLKKVNAKGLLKTKTQKFITPAKLNEENSIETNLSIDSRANTTESKQKKLQLEQAISKAKEIISPKGNVSSLRSPKFCDQQPSRCLSSQDSVDRSFHLDSGENDTALIIQHQEDYVVPSLTGGVADDSSDTEMLLDDSTLDRKEVPIKTYIKKKEMDSVEEDDNSDCLELEFEEHLSISSLQHWDDVSD